jgi:hypothetical protein
MSWLPSSPYLPSSVSRFSTAGVSSGSNPYRSYTRRMTPMTYSRRRTSSGRKSRMPRAGSVRRASVTGGPGRTADGRIACASMRAWARPGSRGGSPRSSRRSGRSRRLPRGQRRRTIAGSPITIDPAARPSPPAPAPPPPRSTRADAAAVEQDGAHPDEAPVLDGAAVDDGLCPTVTWSPITVGWVSRITWTRARILDVGPGPDPDRVDVTPHDDVHPDAALRADVDVADDLRAHVHVRGRVNRGMDGPERSEHLASNYKGCGPIGGAAGTGAHSRGSVTPLLALVLTLLVRVGDLAGLVALEEQHLGDALVGVHLRAGSGVVFEISSVTCPPTPARTASRSR